MQATQTRKHLGVMAWRYGTLIKRNPKSLILWLYQFFIYVFFAILFKSLSPVQIIAESDHFEEMISVGNIQNPSEQSLSPFPGIANQCAKNHMPKIGMLDLSGGETNRAQEIYEVLKGYMLEN